MTGFDFDAPIQVIDQDRPTIQARPGTDRVAVVPEPGRVIDLLPDVELPEMPEDVMEKIVADTGMDKDRVAMMIQAQFAEQRDQHKLIAAKVVDAGSTEYRVGDLVFYPVGRGMQVGQHLMLPTEAIIAFERTDDD